MLFGELQNTVLRPEVLDVIMAEFLDGLKVDNLEADSSRQHFQGRINELEREIQNLVTAIAKGKLGSSALLDSLRDRETELRQLKIMVDKPAHRDHRIQESPRGLRDFARARLQDICDLAKGDIAKAKLELGKHVSKIIMKPDSVKGGYVVEGNWDLLGDRARDLLSGPVECRGDVKVVPGARTVPNVPRVFFNLRVVK